MGLIDKTKQEKQNFNQNKSFIEDVEYQDKLNVEELELLLLLVKQSTFKGEFVETVYNTTLKLQNQYIKQK
jgi:Tfp pilus assembly protein PilN